MLQALFFGLDPFVALCKFFRFAALDPASPEAREFVALEDWLNDGVPLALPVARECLGRWYGANGPGRGAWLVAGKAIVPARFDKPALGVVPARDHIVPPASDGASPCQPARSAARPYRNDRRPACRARSIASLARWLLDGSRASA